MNSFKFLHMADVHLDTPFSSLSSFGGVASERRIEQRFLFKKAMDLAIEKKVEAILIAGDLYEHSYVSRATISFLNECFNSVPNIKIFISPGNHDPFVKNSYYSTYEWAPNVHIFKEKLECINLNNLNVSIYGVGFNDFLLYDSSLKDFEVQDHNRINIMVTHGTVDALSGSPGYHTISTAQLENSGLDYIALGHIHKFIPNLIKGKACYCGAPVALGFDEPGAHGVVIGTIGKEQLDIKFIPIDIREYLTLEVNVTGCQNAQVLVERVLENLTPRLEKSNYYKVLVTGMVGDELLDELDFVKRMLDESIEGFRIAINFKFLPEYDYEKIATGNDLKSLFVKSFLFKIEQEYDDVEKQRLMKALYIGLCALEGRRINPI